MLNSSGLEGLGQTIAIMDQSGKVMSTSRHLMNIFSDAKQAYRERKAELTAAKYAQVDNSRPRAPRRSHTIDDQSVGSSRRSRHHHHHHGDSKSRHRRLSTSPGRPQSQYINASATPRDRGLDSPRYPESPPTPTSGPPTPKSPFPPSPGAAAVPPSLVPHGPDMSMMRRTSLPAVPKRSLSASGIDPNLAYGDIPPNLFEDDRVDEAQLKGLVGRARGLLDEANCLQFSVTQTVQRLQQNPDAMAAIALTLAEISNLVKKMAPGTLLQVRRMAPAVFGLLSSPQFLVAVGVGVGVTIVAFGGYKIVRKIQAKKAAENEAEELMEIRADVSRIETWRRGVADSGAESIGTSVEGEFISPTAARLKALTLNDGTPSDRKSSQPRGESSRSRRARASTVRTKSVRTTRAGSTAGGSSKSGGSSRSKSTREKTVATKDGGTRKRRHRASTVEAKPKPSPLRLMFRSS